MAAQLNAYRKQLIVICAIIRINCQYHFIQIAIDIAIISKDVRFNFEYSSRRSFSRTYRVDWLFLVNETITVSSINDHYFDC